MSELEAPCKPLRETPSNAVRLNDSQKLHLRVSLQYMDQLLQDVEGVLHSAESKSPFPRYRMDLSPAQGRVLEDYIYGALVAGIDCNRNRTSSRRSSKPTSSRPNCSA